MCLSWKTTVQTKFRLPAVLDKLTDLVSAFDDVEQQQKNRGTRCRERTCICWTMLNWAFPGKTSASKSCDNKVFNQKIHVFMLGGFGHLLIFNAVLLPSQ